MIADVKRLPILTQPLPNLGKYLEISLWQAQGDYRRKALHTPVRAGKLPSRSVKGKPEHQVGLLCGFGQNISCTIKKLLSRKAFPRAGYLRPGLRLLPSQSGCPNFRSQPWVGAIAISRRPAGWLSARPEPGLSDDRFDQHSPAAFASSIDPASPNRHFHKIKPPGGLTKYPAHFAVIHGRQKLFQRVDFLTEFIANAKRRIFIQRRCADMSTNSAAPRRAAGAHARTKSVLPRVNR